jgi:hypothetical protein
MHARVQSTAARTPIYLWKRISLAILAALSLGALEARAGQGDIKVVNQTAVLIHPYFKTSCWDGVTIAKTREWVFFGGIGPFSQFTWAQFQALLDPKCRKPVLKFSFTQDGDPPLTRAFHRRVVTMKPFDPTQDYSVTLGTNVVITDVEPDEDDD